MSKFKVGDKVRYKESDRIQCETNGHNFNEIYTISAIERSNNFIWFEQGPGTYAFRLELVENQKKDEQTFDYKQALKILAENPETKIQMLSADKWINTKGFGYLTIHTGEDTLYRVTPVDKFHWLIKSKGKFAVTSGKYATEEDVKAGYSYPVQVIQKLED